MTAVHDYHELHELIDQLEPEQADELMHHTRRLMQGARRRFRVLRTFDGRATNLGARARSSPFSTARIRTIRRALQHQPFPLGLADASVVAVAERLKLTEVATLDSRHVRAIKPKHCTALTLLPHAA